jgi:CheY-like chemotaxis protein
MAHGLSEPSDGATILIVDDDLDTREFIALIVGLAGYHTLEADTGAGALAMVAAQPLHAIVLDLRLPDMDGLAISRQVRTNGHDSLPIILVTADAWPDLRRLAAEAGVTTLIEKPFAPEALLDCLATTVKS